MLYNISSQPISEDIFEKLLYPEGGVLVLVLAFLTLVTLLIGNIILGCVHEHFFKSNSLSSRKIECLFWTQQAQLSSKGGTE